MTIHITDNGKHGYNFSGTVNIETISSEGRCYYCDRDIVFSYNYIINKLKEANLLPENFRKECCFCRLERAEKLYNKKIKR